MYGKIGIPYRGTCLILTGACVLKDRGPILFQQGEAGHSKMAQGDSKKQALT